VVIAAVLMLPALPLLGQELEETEAALEKLRRNIEDIERFLEQSERTLEDWQRQVRDKDQEVASVGKEVEAAGRALRQAEAEISELEAEQQTLESKRQAQAAKIGEHLAASYRMAGEDFIKLLLNQQSPDELNRLMRYHRYFTEARLAALSDYQVTLDAMADNRFRLETQRDDAAAKRESLREEERRLKRERAERQAMIEELTAEAEDKEVRRRRLLADGERLEALIAELRRRATELDGDAFLARRGGLPWPLQGRLMNAFGAPRADGRLSWHGVVIAADEGTPVKAVFRGRVVFANWLRGFGLLTIVDHGSGYMSLYGHADILLKSDGDWVESGETIARAGRSGGQTVSGLYFEVRHKGAAKDPIGWLAKR
jgi:septal ring factor EnvC (AmiA/AmiB activator)